MRTLYLECAMASAVRAASSQTARSLVPALTTAMSPVRGSAW